MQCSFYCCLFEAALHVLYHWVRRSKIHFFPFRLRSVTLYRVTDSSGTLTWPDMAVYWRLIFAGCWMANECIRGEQLYDTTWVLDPVFFIESWRDVFRPGRQSSDMCLPVYHLVHWICRLYIGSWSKQTRHLRVCAASVAVVSLTRGGALRLLGMPGKAFQSSIPQSTIRKEKGTQVGTPLRRNGVVSDSGEVGNARCFVWQQQTIGARKERNNIQLPNVKLFD